jgi:hypothetical protein
VESVKMDNLIASTWAIEFSEKELEPVASKIAIALTPEGSNTIAPSFKAREATLGTPEIIITIVVSAAVKAVVTAGLHAIQRELEGQLGGASDKRIQFIIKGSEGEKKRFPKSLRDIGADALREFIDQVITAVNRMS